MPVLWSVNLYFHNLWRNLDMSGQEHKDKSGDVQFFFFSYHQLPWKGQNPQWIDPTNKFCLCIQSLIQLIPLHHRRSLGSGAPKRDCKINLRQKKTYLCYTLLHMLFLDNLLIFNYSFSLQLNCLCSMDIWPVMKSTALNTGAANLLLRIVHNKYIISSCHLTHI